MTVDDPEQAAMARRPAFGAAGATGDQFPRRGEDAPHRRRVGEGAEIASAAWHAVVENQETALALAAAIRELAAGDDEVVGVAAEVFAQPEQQRALERGQPLV